MRPMLLIGRDIHPTSHPDPPPATHGQQQQVQHHNQLHDSFGHEHELEMLPPPPRRIRRFPKAVRYNVKMEYSQPPGWIRRTPEGKFVLSGDEDDDDDGGFLVPPYGSASPLYHIIGDNGRQQHFISNSKMCSPHDLRSGHSTHSFGCGEIPQAYSPRDPRFRTSSPGFVHLEGFRPLFVEELSSVIHPSSVERSFPTMISSKISPSMQYTPTGHVINSSSSLQPNIILQNSNFSQGYNQQQFRPIHRPIPRQRILSYHQEATPQYYPGIPSPYLRYETERYAPRGHIHIPQPHSLSNVYTNILPRRQLNHPVRSAVRIASAPLPSDMPHSTLPKSMPYESRISRLSPSNRSSSAQHFPHQRFSPGPQVPLKPFRGDLIVPNQDCNRCGTIGPRYPQFSPRTVPRLEDSNHLDRSLKELPMMNDPPRQSPRIFRHYNSPTLGNCDHCTPIGIHLTNDNRFPPPHIPPHVFHSHQRHRHLSPRTPHDHRHHHLMPRPFPRPLDVTSHRVLFSNTPPSFRTDQLIARVHPSPVGSNMTRGYHPMRHRRSPNGTLESGTTDSRPVEYTRDRLQGAIDRVRSTALSRGSLDQPFRNSAPELSNTAPDSIASASADCSSVAKHGGAIPTRGTGGGKCQGDSTVNPRTSYDTTSMTSWTSSGRGSKPSSVVHDELDPPTQSSSSGFGSRDTSHRHSTLSNIALESPQSEPTTLPCGSYMNPLEISVDENYEFDSISPLDPELLGKLRRGIGGSRRGSSGERGVSDSEIYAARSQPRPKRHRKYDNTEARCNALKQEFLRFRRRQQDLQQRRRGYYARNPQLESAC